MGAEGRIQGGGVFSIERPCNSAISRHGFRFAECSQPQPRSIAHPERSLIVHARPPSRGRASTTRQSIRASTIRRAAAIPAAPAPTMTTSVSLLLVTLFCRFELGTAFARAAAVLFPACPLIRVQLQILLLLSKWRQWPCGLCALLARQIARNVQGHLHVDYACCANPRGLARCVWSSRSFQYW